MKIAFTDWVDALAEDPAVIFSGTHTPRDAGGRPQDPNIAEPSTRQRRRAPTGGKRASAQAKLAASANGGSAATPATTLRDHGQFVRGLQRVLCQRVLGNLSPGVQQEQHRVGPAGRPTFSPIFMTQTQDDSPTAMKRQEPRRRKMGHLKQATRTSRRVKFQPKEGGAASHTMQPTSIDTRSPKHSFRGGRAASSLKTARSPVAVKAITSPSSLAEARAEARKAVHGDGVSNPLEHSLSEPLLLSARTSKSLRATHSSDEPGNNTSMLRSKFRYHVRRALLKRQAPSFMRIVELAQVGCARDRVPF